MQDKAQAFFLPTKYLQNSQSNTIDKNNTVKNPLLYNFNAFAAASVLISFCSNILCIF